VDFRVREKVMRKKNFWLMMLLFILIGGIPIYFAINYYPVLGAITGIFWFIPIIFLFWRIMLGKDEFWDKIQEDGREVKDK
jgi:hypothetical protein